MQCDRELMRPPETVHKWHAHVLSVIRAQPLCAKGHEQTNSQRPKYPCIIARSKRSATLQASRWYVVNKRSRSDWAKQAGPECSWDVKVLSCFKMAGRLRGEHDKSSAASQAPQAPCNGMPEPMARWLRQRSSLEYAWWT